MRTIITDYGRKNEEVPGYKHKNLRDEFKKETNDEFHDFGEYNSPTWEYVLWLEKKLLVKE